MGPLKILEEHFWLSDHRIFWQYWVDLYAARWKIDLIWLPCSFCFICFIRHPVHRTRCLMLLSKFFFWHLALLCATSTKQSTTYCTAELLSSRGCPSPSIIPVFSEPVKQINAKFSGKVPFHHASRPFLALLDYISRAHEIELVCPSVRRPSVASIIPESVLHGLIITTFTFSNPDLLHYRSRECSTAL